jgi:hypothetical protein
MRKENESELSNHKQGLLNSASQLKMQSSNVVLSELDTVYDDLQRDNTISMGQKNKLMI